jgi:hypothetical protein
VSTGVVVIAFGLVVETFGLFLLTLVDAALLGLSRRSRLEKPSGPFVYMKVSLSSLPVSRCLSPPPYSLSASSGC